MIDIDAISESPLIGLIPIHFDVPGHYLGLATFLEAISQTGAIVDAFNQDLFDGKLRYELFILPPEEGSFKAKLGILLGCAGVVWAFAESSMGTAFIKGLTTHEPAYWAEKAGDYLRAKVAETLEFNPASIDKIPQKTLNHQVRRLLLPNPPNPSFKPIRISFNQSALLLTNLEMPMRHAINSIRHVHKTPAYMLLALRR